MLSTMSAHDHHHDSGYVHSRLTPSLSRFQVSLEKYSILMDVSLHRRLCVQDENLHLRRRQQHLISALKSF